MSQDSLENRRMIEATGERCVPWAPDAAMQYEHRHRYLWAAELVAGRRTLDLGSGEGYGAEILAQRASEVIGVEIDGRAVEHARERYARPGLRFEQGSALDLSAHESGSFGAVVVFEVIEHLGEHEALLAEVDRVLAPDGLLVISTPDRRFYAEATGQVNPFHARELSLEEFSALLAGRFGHLATYTQRTITGSQITALEEPDEASSGVRDFYVERAGDLWRETAAPPPLFLVAIASHVPLPSLRGRSVLADPGLELVKQVLRSGDSSVAERDRLLADVNRELAETKAETDAKLEAKRDEVIELHELLVETQAELQELREAFELIHESVTWQLFERSRTRVYGLLGTDSPAGRALSGLLRLIGRLLGVGRERKFR